MRIVFGCLLLAASALVPQQSSSQYNSLYGSSDMERFMVRPGVSLTVEYGQDQVACQMLIEGPKASDWQDGDDGRCATFAG
jgi:hypothetical protein